MPASHYRAFVNYRLQKGGYPHEIYPYYFAQIAQMSVAMGSGKNLTLDNFILSTGAAGKGNDVDVFGNDDCKISIPDFQPRN